MERPTPSITRRKALSLLGGAMLVGSSGVATGATTKRNQRPDPVRAYVGAYHWGYFVLDESGKTLDHVSLSVGDELHLTAFNYDAEQAIASLPAAVRKGIPTASDLEKRNQQRIPAPRGATLKEMHEAAEANYPDHSLAILPDDDLRPVPGSGGAPIGPGAGPYGPGRGPYGGGMGPYGRGMGPYGPMGPYGGGMGPYGGGPYGPMGPMGPSGGGMGPYGGGMGPYGGDMELLAPVVYLWHDATVPSEIGFVVQESGSFGFECTVYCGYGHPYMVDRDRLVVQTS